MASQIQILLLLLFLCCYSLTTHSETMASDNDSTNNKKNIDSENDIADSSDDTGNLFDQFVMACSQGEMNIVVQLVQEHPEYVIGYSKNGESCLHVAGILGQSNVTQFILLKGGNPNQRSLNKQGLRMTPLSWNVYGNHIENVKLLLDAGANVNLDFDYMTNDGTYDKFTVLDLLYLVGNFHDNTTSHVDEDDNTHQQTQYVIRDLLLQYGAKRYKELDPQQVEEEKEL
jgi:ankyrin repeat protein